MGTILGWIVYGLLVGAALLELFALIDAATRRREVFIAAGKQTKQTWLILLVIAVLFNPLQPAIKIPLIGGFLLLGGIVAAIVYMVDVRPALREIGGGRRGPRRSSSSDW